MKAWRRVLLTAAVCLWLLGGVARAAAPTLSVRRADGVGEAVYVWERESNGSKYLFLPAYMRGQMLEVSYGDARELSWGQMPIEDGSQTDIITGGMTLNVRVKSGAKDTVDVLQSDTLPAVHLTTASGAMDHVDYKKGNKETGTLRIVAPDGTIDYEGELSSVKAHGNATFSYEKKSYQIKLDKKASLLGMGKGKTYVLLANQYENSLLRNRLTLMLAQALGLPYTSEFRSVDLYANGTYLGNYLLTDKITIGSGSVDVQESEDALKQANEEFLAAGGKPQRYGQEGHIKGTHKGVKWPAEPEDVTGGYLFQLEYETRYKEETSGVVTERGQSVVVKDPQEMSVAQGEYVSELLNRFERAIFARDGVDRKSGQHYTQIADLSSLVRKYLIEEVSKNYDSTKSSQYFFKDSDTVDPLIYAGPVWDYDSAWGNYARDSEHRSVAAPRGLIATGGADYSWWPALYKKADFFAEVKRVYAQELRPMLMAIVGDGEVPEGSGILTLDEMEAELTTSAAMNFSRWRIFNAERRVIKTGKNYEENIEFVRDWIRQRVKYLDETWGV